MVNNNLLRLKDLMKILFLYTLLFLLFYFEPIEISGIKFAVLWKFPLVALLAAYTMLTVLKTKTLPIFVLVGLLLSFKFFISLSSFQYISTTFSEFTKFSIFLFLFLFIQQKYEKETLMKMGKYLSIFIVLSFIPFMTGLLETHGRVIDMSKFGDITGSSLTGIFQNPHGAGITLAFTLLIIFYYTIRASSKKEQIFLIFILFLGISELFLTMVRTALVMFILGSLYIVRKKFRVKHYLILLSLVVGVISYITYQYQESAFLQTIMTRIEGKNKYHSAGGIGSGRLKFQEVAINSWQSEGPFGVIFGLGMELAKDKMYDATGMRLFAHNGFVEMLQSEGLIGFILYLLFLYFLFRFISTFKNSEYYSLVVALYISYIISIYFQGGHYFLLYVLFSIYLALLTKNEIRTIPTKDSKYDFRLKDV